MRLARLALAPLGVGLSLLLSACGHEGVTVPPGANALTKCDVRQIPVEELASVGEPGCDLEGSSLLFPDGTTMEISPTGNVTGHQDSRFEGLEFVIVNWGVPGVGAALVENLQLVDVWASSPEALELQREQLRIEGIAPE